MKAIIQQYSGGDPEIRETPPPALRPGGILVRNEVSLLSPGTERLMVELARKSLLGKARDRPDLVRQVLGKVKRDGIAATLETVRSRLDRPVPLGYSSAGRVIEVARDVTDLRPGDRVACAGAGYASHAEIVFVPRMLVAPVPEGVPLDAATFTTLGAIALQGLRLAKSHLGETVVIIGLGLVGQLAAQLARAAGCRVLGMDMSISRCRLAEALGAEVAVDNPAELLEACAARTGGVGADQVLIAAATKSSEPVVLAGSIARERATVVVVGAVGTEVPRQIFYEKELTLRVSRSYGPGRYDRGYEEEGRDYPIGYVRWTENRNMTAFLEQLARGSISTDELVTHRFPIHSADQAYELIAGKQTDEPSLGILLAYPEAEPREHRQTSSGTRLSSLKPKQGSDLSVIERSSDRAIGLGVLGAGQFATAVLLPVLRRSDRFRLKTVCAATGVSAQHAESKFGFERSTTSADEVLRDPDIEAVLIATRHDRHAPQVLAALEAGKHVFVEKPLCIDDSELEAIESAYYDCQEETDSQKVLMVGFNRRFAPLAKRLRSFTESIHEPLSLHYRVNAGHIPAEHWVQDPRQGGGRIVGEVCHFVDFLCFLTGSTVREVKVMSLPDSNRYRQDNLTAMLRFADSSVGSITYVASGPTALPKERLELFGGGNGAILENFRSLTLIRGGRRRVLRGGLRSDKGFSTELSRFASAIRGVSTDRLIPATAFDTTRVTLAILRQVSEE